MYAIRSYYETLFFLLHIGAVLVPLVLYAHVMLIEQAWGISWPTLPGGLADALTIAAMVAAVLMAIRRIALPEVRIITTPHDWFVLLLTLAVLATGFFSAHQSGGGNDWVLAHIALAEALLIAAPFTKFSLV